MFGETPSEREKELMDHLTCVMEITEEEARYDFDVHELSKRVECDMEFFTNGEIVNKKSGLSAFLHWLKNQNSFFSTVTEKLKVIITLLLF